MLKAYAESSGKKTGGNPNPKPNDLVKPGVSNNPSNAGSVARAGSLRPKGATAGNSRKR